METRRLGRTATEVTRLGMGGGPLGGLFTPVDHDDAAATLAAAWEAGIRYFDTAPHYGIGQSERWFGEFLRTRPRDQLILSTKVGRVLVEHEPAGHTDEAFKVPATHRRVWDFSRDGIRRSLYDSLERMDVDRVDVLYLHDAEQHFEVSLREGYPALAELRSEGVVTAIGAGMGESALLARMVREADVDVVMLAGRYTLLDQSALDDLLPACQQRQVSVAAASVFNSGILAQDHPTTGAHYEYAPASETLLRRARRIAEVCASHDVTLPRAAIAFPLTHPAVASVVLGMRSPQEVRINAGHFSAPVPSQLWVDLRDQGLLDERVPIDT